MHISCYISTTEIFELGNYIRLWQASATAIEGIQHAMLTLSVSTTAASIRVLEAGVTKRTTAAASNDRARATNVNGT